MSRSRLVSLLFQSLVNRITNTIQNVAPRQIAVVLVHLPGRNKLFSAGEPSSAQFGSNFLHWWRNRCVQTWENLIYLLNCCNLVLVLKAAEELRCSPRCWSCCCLDKITGRHFIIGSRPGLCWSMAQLLSSSTGQQFSSKLAQRLDSAWHRFLPLSSCSVIKLALTFILYCFRTIFTTNDLFLRVVCSSFLRH